MWKLICKKYKVKKINKIYFFDAFKVQENFKMLSIDKIFCPIEKQIKNVMIIDVKLNDLAKGFNLTRPSLEFLENSKRGNAFCGIIDLVSHEIHLHPLYPDHERTLRTLNKDELTPYTGEYPDEAFIKMPIVHSYDIFTKNHPDITNNKITWYSSGGTSHKTLEELICKKEGEKNENNERFIGFTIINTCPDEHGKYILSKDLKIKSAFRNRSRAFNTKKPTKFFMTDDEKYVAVSEKEFNDEDKILENMYFTRRKFHDQLYSPYLPQNLSKKIAIFISEKISKNKKLKETLLIFNETDIFI